MKRKLVKAFMKLCIIGLGSIGKRHFKNISKVLKSRKIVFEIDAFRSNKEPLQKDIASMIHKEYYSYDQLPKDYDVIFITNPTVLHFETLKNILAKTKHVFIEKPIFDNTNYNMEELEFSENNIYYVACPIRHKEIIKYAKEFIEKKEKIISARTICSSYLPKWREGVDYKSVYSAKKSLGGGASIDLIHEWDYLIYLFGVPINVYNIKSQYSNLEIDCDDISVYIANYIDKVVEVHLDYIGQKLERKLELFTNERRIDLDLIENKITIYKNYKIEKEVVLPSEDFYLTEMNYFFDCINGEKHNFNKVEDALNVLKIVLNEK